MNQPEQHTESTPIRGTQSDSCSHTDENCQCDTLKNVALTIDLASEILDEL